MIPGQYLSERVVLIVLVQIGSLDVAHRLASLATLFILAFNPSGTGAIINALLWIVVWSLGIFAIWAPAAWYFRAVEGSVADGLIIGCMSVMVYLLIDPSDLLTPISMLVIYTGHGFFSSTRALVA